MSDRPLPRAAVRPLPRLGAPAAILAAALALAACGPVAVGGGPGCLPDLQPHLLPLELDEASGVAGSLRHSGVYWLQQDAGSVLYAVDGQGALLARFPVRPQLRDWEDLALAPCGERRHCLYMADLGDNYEERDHGRILRIGEPDPTAPDTLHPDVFPVRLPDGPRDVEAILVFPGERILAITKGRNHPVTVYRYPGPLRPDTVVMEEVQRLSDGPRILPRQVTGGAVAPGGMLAAVRTYESLHFYRFVGDTLVPVEGGLVNLRPLREPQGEGVAVGLGGQVVLVSEGGPGRNPGSMSFLRCRIEGL